jgi:hypothetical protein
MLQAPKRTALSGPTLVRLLARLTDLDVPESRQSLSDRLSQWLGWTDAIALSSALNGSPPVVAAGARAFGSVEENECARVRTALVRAIADDGAAPVVRRRGTAKVPQNTAAADFPVFRQRCLAIQQAMETDIGLLRGRLRAMLAAKTPAMTRLARVDAVMERALSERERSLLAAVPALLGRHFERLRQAEQASMAAAQASGDAAEATPGAWLDVFRKDMQSVLLAELDVRFQPVEGLLAALRTC